MVTELDFKILKNTDNINLLYSTHDNGYYITPDKMTVYEVISSIKNNKDSCVQYRYKQNSQSFEESYMYRIGNFSNNFINWTSWKTSTINKENNEFHYNEDSESEKDYLRNVFSNSVIRDRAIRARDNFFEKQLTPKKKFYPNPEINESTKFYKDHYGIMLSTIKRFGFINITGNDYNHPTYKNYITLTHLDFDNDYQKSLIRDFPEAKQMIRININGYFIIPPRTWINLPLSGTLLHTRPREYISRYGSDVTNPVVITARNDFTAEGLDAFPYTFQMNINHSINNASNPYFLTGPEESVLLVETMYHELEKKWTRSYMYFSLNELMVCRGMTLFEENSFPNYDSWRNVNANLFPEELTFFIGENDKPIL